MENRNPQETSTTTPSRQYSHLILVFIVSLALRAMLYVVRAQGELNGFGGDVPTWIQVVYHLRDHFDFTHPMMTMRQPLFPLTAALILRLGGTDAHAAALQTLFGTLTPLVSYLLAWRLFLRSRFADHAPTAALIVGLLHAIDPAAVSTSVLLQGEPLFNLLFVSVMLAAVTYIQTQKWPALLICGVLIMAAMWTRGTGIFLWLLIPMMFVPFVRQWWKPALLIMLMGLSVFMAWSWRNWQVHGVFTYSLQTNFQMLYLRALSAEHLATGRDTEELRAEYSRELYEVMGEEEKAEAATPDSQWEFLIAPTPEVYVHMGKLAREKLIRNWTGTLLGLAPGLWRMFSITEPLPEWVTPIELVYRAVIYALAAWGGWSAYRRREWLLLAATLLPIAYVTALTLIQQVSVMDTRMASPLISMIVILSVYGIFTLRANSRWLIADSETSRAV